jgi:chromodomain-helicase-DNA-binding protein 4
MRNRVSQVQEFEHINGYYSMPELVKRPVDPVKPDGTEGTQVPSTATSTSATPATSAAASPAPAKDEEGKDKETVSI